jgi:GxxExxY protein
MQLNQITEIIIGAAIEVHRTVGPGLLESTYEECLCVNYHCDKLSFNAKWPCQFYKDILLDCGYRLDYWCQIKLLLSSNRLKRLNQFTKHNCFLI